MKARYLTLLVAAVILMAGPGFAQPTDNSWEVMDGLLLCPAGAGAGDTVTGYIVFGGVIQTRADFEAVGHDTAWLGIMDHWTYDDLDVAMAEDGGISVDLPGDFSPSTGLACGTGIADGWPAGVEMAAAAYTADAATYLADGYFGDVGGASCPGGEPPAPEVSARITGPHNVGVGADVTLEVVTDGIDEGTETYLWNDASTGATLALGIVDAGDTGVYTCEVSGDVDEEPLEEPLEASFTLWVGVATPLAGGLGLGLLAGACALAGVIAIRRKK